mmetsp:Transcript_59932/g.154254  ORF Transcript_59932/g.154254 Transcript_59932/m.154254 type:complete len:215 (+) Transcript_59932:847-1491(+)
MSKMACPTARADNARYVYFGCFRRCSISVSKKGVAIIATPTTAPTLLLATASSFPEKTSAKAAEVMTVFENVVRIMRMIRQNSTVFRCVGLLNTRMPQRMLLRGPAKRCIFRPVVSEILPPAWLMKRPSKPTKPEVLDSNFAVSATSPPHNSRTSIGSDCSVMTCWQTLWNTCRLITLRTLFLRASSAASGAVASALEPAGAIALLPQLPWRSQ